MKDRRAKKEGRRVALVLGSGGARGYAHIGVIEELEARGFEIAGIAGCSMGALIGGVYAAGQLGAYREWVSNLDYLDLLRLVDVTWSPMGAIRGERVMEHIGELLQGQRIESLPIQFTSVATDLTRHREVWFQEGPLDEAIRASIAVPGVITPLYREGRALVDGGLLNPLPMAPVAAYPADLIIAVNAAAERSRASLDDAMESLMGETQTAESGRLSALAEWVERVRGQTRRLLGRVAGGSEDEEDASGGDGGVSGDPGSDARWGKLALLLQSFEVTQAALSQYKVAGYPPDVLIEVPRAVCGAFEFHKAPQLMELGRRLAAEALGGHGADKAGA